MKRIYVLFIAIFTLAFMANVNAVTTPYLPPLQSFGGTSVDLATFLPSGSDYTLEVQGTVGVEISIAGGVLAYTPTTNGVVRFSQKSGKVYVYEGNVYKATLTPNAVQATFPSVYDDANLSAIDNAENLIVNPGFETTTGANLGTTDQRYAAATWMLSGNYPTYTSSGIRVNKDNASYVTGREKLCTLLWRNDATGANNINTYFYQSLGSKLKPNTAYKIKFHVLTHNQSRSCNWRVGVGSTSGGYQYSLNTFKPVSTNFTSQSFEYTFTTPSTVAPETFFTIGNAGDATSGTWTIIHLDRITMVEGVATKGISNVSSALFLEGNAYAPENVMIDFSAGDSYDMTGLIINPTIEGPDNNTVPTGWTADKGTGNSFTNTGQHYSNVSTNRYLDSWNGTPGSMLYTAQQTLNGIPNGVYKLSAAARTSGAGSYVVAKTSGNTYMTEIINNANAGGTLGNGFSTIEVYATVLDNTLTIAASTSAAFTGGTTWDGTWFSVDDFVLNYYGEQIMDVTVNDPENARLLFNTVGETIVVPIVAYGYTNGFTVAADQPALFEVTNGSLLQSGGSVSVRFIGNTVGVYNGILNVTMNAPETAPGMKRIISIGNSIQIPMVATITTGVNNLENGSLKTYLVGNDVIAQFGLAKSSNVNMSVYGINGSLIASEIRNLNAGTQQMIIKANLPAGVYFVKVNIDGEITTTKLVK